MRKVLFRGVVLVVSAVLAFGVFAAPRDGRAPRSGDGPVKRIVKKIKALGDLITVPIP